MTWNGVTNWILVKYTATSLYIVIADGNYRETNAGRAAWMSLVNGAKLQRNCNKEGFNVPYPKCRIGIVGNNEFHCSSCDSVIGFGIEKGNRKCSSGNIQFYPEPQKITKTFGYIFVQ